MKFIVISGSRNPAGQTARAAGAVRKGLEAGGNGTETVLLSTLKIERCRQCDDNGWGICRTEGRCVIADDFAELVGKIRAADGAVFATPVYYGDLSESLRAFLDRLRRVCTHAAGRAGVEGKRAVGVCVAGGGGGGASNCCLSLEKVLSTCGFNVADTVPVRRQNLEAKLPALELTGSALVRTPQA
jgi:multimeric flavodoxin WrbA